jgi:hypothetical protein
MKNIVVLAILLTVVFSGCMTTNENRAMSALYSTDIQTRQDIRGTITVDSLLLWKSVGMGGNKILTLEKASMSSVSQYFFVVDCLIKQWIFVDSLMLRIDNGNVITLKDASPARETDRRGNNFVGVHEIANFAISNEIIEQLKKCNSLILQFEQSPITIPVEGLNAIKTFLNK